MKVVYDHFTNQLQQITLLANLLVYNTKYATRVILSIIKYYFRIVEYSIKESFFSY